MELDASLKQPAGSILVVTGGRNAGKTTFCRGLSEQWQGAGLKTAGILSPGRFVGGEKTGFFALDLASGESRLLASLVKGELEGLKFDPWVFDVQTLAWGNRLLSESGFADLLVIDELGPLEFQLRQGWTAAFDLLRRKEYRLALVVVRPECLPDFSELGFQYNLIEIRYDSPPRRSKPGASSQGKRPL